MSQDVRVSLERAHSTYIAIGSRVIVNNNATMSGVEPTDPFTCVDVNSGAVVRDCNFYNNQLTILSGGSVVSTTVKHGFVDAGNFCTVSGLSIGNDWYGCAECEYRHRGSSGAHINNLVLLPHGSAILTYSASSMPTVSVTESGGAYVHKAAGSTVTPTFISNSFSIPYDAVTPYLATVHANTSVTSAYITRGGVLQVFSGGSVRTATVYKDGVLSMQGGVVNDSGSGICLYLQGGTAKITSGGSINSAVVFMGGQFRVISGGDVHITDLYAPYDTEGDLYHSAANDSQGGDYTVSVEGASIKYVILIGGNASFTSANITSTLSMRFSGRATINGGFVGNIYVGEGGSVHLGYGTLYNGVDGGPPEMPVSSRGQVTSDASPGGDPRIIYPPQSGA